MKKNLIFVFSVLTAVLSLTEAALAQIIVSPTVYYSEYRSKDDNETNSVESTSKGLLADGRVGLLMEYVFIGGIYGHEQSIGTTGSSEYRASARRYGPSIGFVFENFNFFFHYFMVAELNSKFVNTEVNYSEGTGFQLDLGWKFPLADFFSIGPQMNYRNINYNKRTRITTSATEEGKLLYNRTEIEPRLAFWFIF